MSLKKIDRFLDTALQMRTLSWNRTQHHGELIALIRKLRREVSFGHVVIQILWSACPEGAILDVGNVWIPNH